MKNRIFGGKMDQTFYKKLAGLMIPIMFQNLMLASGGGGGCNHARRVSSRIHMAAVSSGDTDSVHPEYVSDGGNRCQCRRSLGAQYWGKGDQDTLNDIFCMALRLCAG